MFVKVISMYNDDTIAAISTAPGEGAIGIVRISGGDSLPILNKIFEGRKKSNKEGFQSYTLRYGIIHDPENKTVIDEVLVSYMKSPYTYTKEDIVEINCHGGVISIKKILELVLKMGARLAEPGEFTRRAFLNGRIDLTQAEAVIDVIRSKTEAGMHAALKQLEGKLSHNLRCIKDKLLNIMSHIEASIDFPEDDIEEVIQDKLYKDCSEIIKSIDAMISSADTGRIIREGLNTIIVGKPNVGKSSLLNALIEQNRAIVTDIPGTTRDIIEEHLNIAGVPVNIIDTAGIRETEDMIERIGVERTKEYLSKADLVIFILDYSDDVSSDDKEIFDLIKNRKSIILMNKVDLPARTSKEEIEKMFPNQKIIEVSVKEGKGIDLLKHEIYDIVYSGQVKYSSEVLVTNIRHMDLLMKSKYSLKNALESLSTGIPLDLVSIDINQSLQFLSEITGESIGEDIIDRIFSQFCVGK